MGDLLFLLILETGAIVPAILGAAFLLWHLGLRDPFLLTVCAVVVGGAVGWGVNVVLFKVLPSRWKSSSAKRRRRVVD